MKIIPGSIKHFEVKDGIASITIRTTVFVEGEITVRLDFMELASMVGMSNQVMRQEIKELTLEAVDIKRGRFVLTIPEDKREINTTTDRKRSGQ